MENKKTSEENLPFTSDETNPTDLSKEGWFHGPIPKREAEELLTQEGDFLVRETRHCKGRYVLTVKQSGYRGLIHCLLNGQGVIGTKEKNFETVSDLINYYLQSGFPIIPLKPELVIKRPILKKINFSTTNQF